MSKSSGRFWKALVSGGLGGVAGGWSMNQLVLKLSGASRPHGAQALRPVRQNLPASRSRRSGDPTTKVGALVIQELNGIQDHVEGRERGGTIVHYSFAAAAGTVYGVVAEFSRLRGIGGGCIFAAALWFGADFVLLPLMSLSRPAPTYGWRVEALSLAGHLAYGTVLESARARLRRLL